MKVKFLCDFGGRETKEVHYAAGFETELDDEIATELIARDICVSLEKPEGKPQEAVTKPAGAVLPAAEPVPGFEEPLDSFKAEPVSKKKAGKK